MASMSDIMMRQIEVVAKYNGNNEVEFLNNVLVGGYPIFKSNDFKKYKAGDIIKCTFRVNDTSRALIKHEKVEEDAVDSMSSQSASSYSRPFAQTFEKGMHSSISFPEPIAKAFDIANQAMACNDVFTMCFRGPSGYGKTAYSQAYAEEMGLDYIYVNCAAITDPEEWFIFREAKDGATHIQLTDFSQAIINGNVVVVLDEINRVQPWISNALLPILDYRRRTTIHNIDIQLGQRILFVLTLNEGYRFTGTFQLDEAIANRVDITETVAPLGAAAENDMLMQNHPDLKSTDAHNITQLMGELRKAVEAENLEIDVSTRISVGVAKMVSRYATSVIEAINLKVTNRISPIERKPIIDAIKKAEAKFVTYDSFSLKGAVSSQFTVEFPKEPGVELMVRFVKFLSVVLGVGISEARKSVGDAILNDMTPNETVTFELSIPQTLAVDEVIKMLNAMNIRHSLTN